MRDRTVELSLIICPRCGHEFPLTDALRRQLEAALRRQLEADYAKKRRRLEARLREQKARWQREARRQAEREFGSKLAQAERRAAQAEARLARETQRAALAAKREAQVSARKELAARLEALRREQREVARRERALEGRERKLEAELRKRSERAEREARRRYEAREKELEKQLHAAQRHIRDLEGRLRQGSPQEQGRIVEADFAELLRRLCPADEVTRVKGAGPDVLQVVRTGDGRVCGTILWEVKRQRRWNGRWLEKLRKDRQRLAAETAVLVTSVLPKEPTAEAFPWDGLWVAHDDVALALALPLRNLLIELHRARELAGADEALKALRDYLTSVQFRERILAMAGALRKMREGLAREQKYMADRWRERELEIVQAGEAVQGVVVDLQHHLGPAAVPALPELSALGAPGARALGPGVPGS